MPSGYGTILDCTDLINNGDPASRYNFLFLGDGFRLEELSKYQAATESAIEAMFSIAPFNGIIRSAINVYRIDVVSEESGATDPTDCGGTGVSVNTYFGASYCGTVGIRRHLTVDKRLVRAACDNKVPKWHVAVVLVNSDIWGGAGGDRIGTSSLSKGFEHTVIHEWGHSSFGLADEYSYSQGCDSGEETQNRYVGAEPSAANTTINTDRATLKWGSFVLPNTNLPTQSNPDCEKCDESPSPVPAGTVGLFEGSGHYHCGQYRPEFKCMMRGDVWYFCVACRERIRTQLRTYIPTQMNAWTSIKDAGGNWSADFTALGGLASLPKKYDQIECTTFNNQLVGFLIDDNKLYFSTRSNTGIWGDFKSVAEQVNGLGSVLSVSCAGVGSQLFVCVITDAMLKIAILDVSGTWELAFTDVSQFSSGLGVVSDVALAGVNNQLFILVRSDDNLLFGFRNPAGKWQESFLDVADKSTGLGDVSAISCAGVGTQMMICVLSGGKLLHTLLNSDGTWQAEFINVGQESTGLTAPTEIRCAGLGDQLYVAVVNAGVIDYTVRNPDGTWNSAFANVEEFSLGLERIGDIACSSIGGQFILCAIAS